MSPAGAAGPPSGAARRASRSAVEPDEQAVLVAEDDGRSPVARRAEVQGPQDDPIHDRPARDLDDGELRSVEAVALEDRDAGLVDPGRRRPGELAGEGQDLAAPEGRLDEDEGAGCVRLGRPGDRGERGPAGIEGRAEGDRRSDGQRAGAGQGEGLPALTGQEPGHAARGHEGPPVVRQGDEAAVGQRCHRDGRRIRHRQRDWRPSDEGGSTSPPLGVGKEQELRLRRAAGPVVGVGAPGEVAREASRPARCSAARLTGGVADGAGAQPPAAVATASATAATATARSAGRARSAGTARAPDPVARRPLARPAAGRGASGSLGGGALTGGRRRR